MVGGAVSETKMQSPTMSKNAEMIFQILLESFLIGASIFAAPKSFAHTAFVSCKSNKF